MAEKHLNSALDTRARSAVNRKASARRSIHPVVPYIAPMVILLAAVLLFPLLYSFYLSFSDITPNLEIEFSGVGNYVEVLTDRRVARAFNHSAVFTVASVAGQFTLAILGALLLNEKLPGRRWFRLALLLPWVIPPVVGTLTWRWMLDSHYGIVNDWLLRLGVIPSFRSWLGSPDTALPAAILVNVWRGFPFMTVMLLAGLQGISEEYYDAAKVDGAGPLQRFRYVTLPALRYTIAVATTISAIWAFKEFVIVHLLTEGGPAGASEVVVTLVYKMFFHFSRFGDAAALGVLVLLVLLVFAGFYARVVIGNESEGQSK